MTNDCKKVAPRSWQANKSWAEKMRPSLLILFTSTVVKVTYTVGEVVDICDIFMQLWLLIYYSDGQISYRVYLFMLLSNSKRFIISCLNIRAWTGTRVPDYPSENLTTRRYPIPEFFNFLVPEPTRDPKNYPRVIEFSFIKGKLQFFDIFLLFCLW